MDDRATVLAIDLGGSSLRVALIGRDGATRALHALARDAAAIEADPEEWWRAVQTGAAALRAQAPAAFARVAAIAVSAFTRGMVLLDAAGAPLRPAMLFTDARAAEVVEELRAGLPADHAETPQVNAFHPLARLLRLARTEPATLARAAFVIEPKDELNRRFTGRVASDPVSSARLLAAADLLAPLGLPRLLPEMHRPGEIMGQVRAGLPGALAALARVPVMAMAHDTWAAVTGLGAMRAGRAYCISGTTEVLGLLHHAPAAAPGLLTVAWDGLWQVGGPSQHGADALAWLAALGIDPQRGDPPPGELVPILFLPSLAGERVPHWDPDLRGAFLGLHRAHGAAEMLRAVMQGVAFNNRAVLERAESAAGIVATEIRLGGGGATPGWAQLRADITGRDVVLTEAREPGLLGCAIAAFAALEGRPLAAMQEELARPAARFRADPARHARADALHAIFRSAEGAVAPLSHRLARLA